ncbi:hypothetical protein L3Q82_004530 [Scortum barcoo]|uniref:Uncharacterized protein n=1 Tax=Scortum barcoo TaxID=214431 RepID=A0ACB8VH39_9TELE|nr:hypothetical protein L3Q82_004530 [Scortum barcoo]
MRGGIGSSRLPGLPRLLPKPHCTGPSWTFLRVVSLLEGGPTCRHFGKAEPGRVPWAKTRPPGARLRAPTPGLAPGWGPRQVTAERGVTSRAAASNTPMLNMGRMESPLEKYIASQKRREGSGGG